MCGRYTVTSTDGIVEELSLAAAPGELPSASPDKPEAEAIQRSPLAGDPDAAALLRTPRYNVAPTQLAPVIRNRAVRFVEPLRWGLVPFWAKSLSVGVKMINARSETVADKPPFRTALRDRRCLVVADGFYEWKRDGKQRRPFYFRPRAGGLLTFAGLWERWKGPDGIWVRSFTILTTTANELVEPLHDRMPVILTGDDRDRWLGPDPIPAEPLLALLRPAPADSLVCFEVSPAVNRADHEGPDCILPVNDLPPPQRRLFDP
jgi:putative SOS response-associated peptidase YedK